MIRLVTIEDAKAWLRVIHNADDEQIDLCVLAATRAVLDYLDISEDVYVDSDGVEFDSDGQPIRVGDVERIATLLLVRRLYDGDMENLDYGRLPNDVTSMLYIRRRNLGVA